MRYSILTDNLDKCIMCGSESWIELHEVFFGKNRKLSIQHGLVAPLCHYCHNEPPNGVHHNKYNDMRLKRLAQEVFMARYEKTEEEFIKIFGKNYL